MAASSAEIVLGVWSGIQRRYTGFLHSASVMMFLMIISPSRSESPALTTEETSSRFISFFSIEYWALTPASFWILYSNFSGIIGREEEVQLLRTGS